jgi:hypothetical protein
MPADRQQMQRPLRTVAVATRHEFWTRANRHAIDVDMAAARGKQMTELMNEQSHHQSESLRGNFERHLLCQFFCAAFVARSFSSC